MIFRRIKNRLLSTENDAEPTKKANEKHTAQQPDSTQKVRNNPPSHMSQRVDDKTAETKIRPELAEVGYYGPIGEAARITCDGFRALPQFVMLSLLTRLSASIKRGNVMIKNGGQTTPLRLFTIAIMKSGGGKGISEGRAQLVIDRAESFTSSTEPMFAKVHQGGLSTPEGIVYELRDDTVDDKGETVEGVSDKRRCIIEGEFAEILIKCKSNGSTLSTTLRKVFDGEDLSPMIKHNRVTCTSPHISIHAHITPKEYLKEVNPNDMYNGFCNRFMTIIGMPKPPIPFPKEFEQHALDDAARKIADAVTWCNEAPRVVQFSPCFKEQWPAIQQYFFNMTSDESLKAVMLTRMEYFFLMFCGLFAAMDKSEVATIEHFRAAEAWMKYWEDSFTYIFDAEAEAVEIENRKAKAKYVLDTIKDIVSSHGESSFHRTLLTRKVSKKLNSKELNEALKYLQELPEQPIKVVKTGTKNGQVITLTQ
ncbi:conserved hypothetical protein [Vibrio jasicida]|uniref:DUF3987 domain-containing protein n=1 Tax=Vibrio jasicida TaxID=766224 RepID=UPI002896000B|nr:conserved hypothetical protein [Vibrio jasicida]